MAVSVLIWYIAPKLPRYKYLISVIGLIIYFSGALISNGLLSSSLEINPQRIVWNVEETNLSIIKHQQSDDYVKYRIRLLFFNKSVYVYSIFTNIAGILSLKNLYDTLLLANIYPLILGIREAFKYYNKLINKIILWGFGLTLLASGIARSTDNFSTLFIAIPVLITLILLGLRKANKFVYLILLIFSLILTTRPFV